MSTQIKRERVAKKRRLRECCNEMYKLKQYCQLAHAAEGIRAIRELITRK
jgi:hypothetical protein